VVVRAPMVARMPTPAAPRTPGTPPNMPVALRTHRTASATPVPAVAPPQTAAAVISQAPPPTRVVSPAPHPIVPEGERSFVPPVSSSPAPQSPSRAAQPSAPVANATATPEAPPTPAETQMVKVECNFMLDGAQIGRWISSAMAKEAARPPTAARGFNTRMTPAWPSIPL
jgi:hypothetical protein